MSDPFDLLYDATLPLIIQLEETSPQSIDFMTIQNELVQCIQDLESSITAIEASKQVTNPFTDITQDTIADRKSRVNKLRRDLNRILEAKNINKLSGGYSENPFSDNNNNQTEINEDTLDVSTREYQQQQIREQDLLISTDLTNSIQTLHNQATAISHEIRYQDTLLEDVDNEMDRLNFKIVGTGVKRIEKFLADNESTTDCCVWILVVVLIVILVLVMII
ncbi:hypothetical protein CANINC_000089 [Pichia inconspicua]|uniref:t-SNARE coiled-coil homology domain-containing protein n=1 Tax=Pichia inconspicua TaxID=52247 RepID=A0A4T0X7G4_9ASCO|nr:hypothetical protein CANINC_000089 [[Candida] inconspicua]